MSFKATRISPAVVIADERLYLDAARENIVSEGDPRAAHLLAAVGLPVPPQWVAKLGGEVGQASTTETVGTEPVRRSTRPARVAHIR